MRLSAVFSLLLHCPRRPRSAPSGPGRPHAELHNNVLCRSDGGALTVVRTVETGRHVSAPGIWLPKRGRTHRGSLRLLVGCFWDSTLVSRPRDSLAFG